jgi:uncharacterized membrane protein
MPVVYLVFGVMSGVLAALSSWSLGHPILFSILTYVLAGGICILLLAMSVQKQKVGYSAD